MVSPYDAGQLAATMNQILGDPALREKLVQAGLKQVRKFNWQRVARNTLAIYYEVFHSQEGSEGSKRRFLPYDRWLTLKAYESARPFPTPLKELV